MPFPGEHTNPKRKRRLPCLFPAPTPTRSVSEGFNALSRRPHQPEASPANDEPAARSELTSTLDRSPRVAIAFTIEMIFKTRDRVAPCTSNFVLRISDFAHDFVPDFVLYIRRALLSHKG
jgi:hypothetical protein